MIPTFVTNISAFNRMGCGRNGKNPVWRTSYRSTPITYRADGHRRRFGDWRHSRLSADFGVLDDSTRPDRAFGRSADRPTLAPASRSVVGKTPPARDSSHAACRRQLGRLIGCLHNANDLLRRLKPPFHQRNCHNAEEQEHQEFCAIEIVVLLWHRYFTGSVTWASWSTVRLAHKIEFFKSKIWRF